MKPGSKTSELRLTILIVLLVLALASFFLWHDKLDSEHWALIVTALPTLMGGVYTVVRGKVKVAVAANGNGDDPPGG